MTIELSEFYQTFFDEASEHLATMESLLLELNVESPDLDDLNAIFRSAHSIKGGSGMFGFNEMTEVTHILETLLDHLRKGELVLRDEMVDAFLQAADVLKGMVAARQGGEAMAQETIDTICARLQSLSETNRQGAEDTASESDAEVYDIRFVRESTPLADPAPFDFLIDTLKGTGQLDVVDAGDRPGSEAHFRLTRPKSLDEIHDAFAFFIQPGQYTLSKECAQTSSTRLAPSKSETSSAVQNPVIEPVKSQVETESDPGFGFFVDIPQLPAAQPSRIETEPSPSKPREATQSPKPTTQVQANTPQSSKAQASVDTSIRVNVEKVDQLINLAGELVITQAMLKQTASLIDPVLHENLHNGIALLERNTRDLQEAVMSIRMIPMSFVFARFPRMVRDLSAKMKKEVNFKTHGENTELDKGLIEKITDPLTHLVRNSLDHGIEASDVREAKGKDRKGNLVLRAFHQGGNVVIQVQDDGAGLHREKILAKARERGLNVSDAMTDQEVWQLIMAPGFSTAEVVTDVSGRGVGMDVVKKNIESLGGRVEIESYAGAGTTMTIRLPLTLAILDGLSIAVGEETFIIPLTSIIESLQPRREDIKTVAGEGRLVHVRGEYLPLVALHQVFGARPRTRVPEQGTLMIVEADGVRAALLVDELLGQHQVVIKSLETNYRKVLGVSGATIMGDGRVALILDVNALVRMSKTYSSLPQVDFAEVEEKQTGQNIGPRKSAKTQNEVDEVGETQKAETRADENDEDQFLDKAVAAHQRWKTRLRMLLDGQGEKLDHRVVCQDDQCDLGKWIYGYGSQYSRLAAFKDLKSLHAQFHKCAGEIVKKYQSGDQRGAEQLLGLGGPFMSTSIQTVNAIKKLQSELRATQPG